MKHMLEPTVQKTAATAATFGGASLATGSGALGWLGENASAINAIGVIIGIVIGVIGLGVKWYYLNKEYQLEKEEHDKKLGK